MTREWAPEPGMLMQRSPDRAPSNFKRSKLCTESNMRRCRSKWIKWINLLETLPTRMDDIRGDTQGRTNYKRSTMRLTSGTWHGRIVLVKNSMRLCSWG